MKMTIIIRFSLLTVFLVCFQNLTIAQDDCSDVMIKGSNVVYIGLENPISISIEGYSSDQISATAEDIHLSLIENGLYTVKIPDTTHVGWILKISIFDISNNSKKLLCEKMFKAMSIPLPVPYFGSMTSGVINKGEVKFIRHISVKQEGFPWDLGFEVTRFTLTIHPKNGGSFKSAKSSNSNLSQQMISWLQAVQSGDKILVTDIWAESPALGNKKLNRSINLVVE